MLGGGADVERKRAVSELSEGDVDGEGKVVGEDSGGGEGAAEELLGELAHDPGLFGEGNEVCRINGTDYGMLPARKNLEAGKHTGTELDERLEVGDDLIVVQRSAEVDLSLFLINHPENLTLEIPCMVDRDSL